jgi:hypothetical protein
MSFRHWPDVLHGTRADGNHTRYSQDSLSRASSAGSRINCPMFDCLPEVEGARRPGKPAPGDLKTNSGNSGASRRPLSCLARFILQCTPDSSIHCWVETFELSRRPRGCMCVNLTKYMVVLKMLRMLNNCKITSVRCCYLLVNKMAILQNP